MKVHIPNEIWIHILSFLPKSFRRELISVNSALFDIAMNERYREVDITKIEKKTLWIISRLRYVVRC